MHKSYCFSNSNSAWLLSPEPRPKRVSELAICVKRVPRRSTKTTERNAIGPLDRAINQSRVTHSRPTFHSHSAPHFQHPRPLSGARVSQIHVTNFNISHLASITETRFHTRRTRISHIPATGHSTFNTTPICIESHPKKKPPSSRSTAHENTQPYKLNLISSSGLRIGGVRRTTRTTTATTTTTFDCREDINIKRRKSRLDAHCGWERGCVC